MHFFFEQLVKAYVLHVSHRITCVGLEHASLDQIFSTFYACILPSLYKRSMYNVKVIQALTRMYEYTVNIEYKLACSNPCIFT